MDDRTRHALRSAIELSSDDRMDDWRRRLYRRDYRVSPASVYRTRVREVRRADDTLDAGRRNPRLSDRYVLSGGSMVRECRADEAVNCERAERELANELRGIIRCDGVCRNDRRGRCRRGRRSRNDVIADPDSIQHLFSILATEPHRSDEEITEQLLMRRRSIELVRIGIQARVLAGGDDAALPDVDEIQIAVERASSRKA